MKTITLILSLLFSLVNLSARDYSMKFVGSMDTWCPDSLKVSGSTQGFAMHGRYGFILHDKGQCVIVDMKSRKFVSTYKLDPVTNHCNNANFGKEKYSGQSRFPLLYVSECRGRHSCIVLDADLKGARIVQRIFFDGSGYDSSVDWCLDSENGYIYTYGGRKGNDKIIKKFTLPKLSDSDASGEVHLTDNDVLEETVLKDIYIYQGSIVRDGVAYLPDGYPPYDRKIHIFDLKTGKKIHTFDVNSLNDEPEGVALKGNWMYVAFHRSKQGKNSQIWKFKIR